MNFVKIKAENFEELMILQKAYKVEIGECMPTNVELESLKKAIENEQIHFYGCICDNSLIRVVLYAIRTQHSIMANLECLKIFIFNQSIVIRG